MLSEYQSVNSLILGSQGSVRRDNAVSIRVPPPPLNISAIVTHGETLFEADRSLGDNSGPAQAERRGPVTVRLCPGRSLRFVRITNTIVTIVTIGGRRVHLSFLDIIVVTLTPVALVTGLMCPVPGVTFHNMQICPELTMRHEGRRGQVTTGPWAHVVIAGVRNCFNVFTIISNVMNVITPEKYALIFIVHTRTHSGYEYIWCRSLFIHRGF